MITGAVIAGVCILLGFCLGVYKSSNEGSEDKP